MPGGDCRGPLGRSRLRDALLRARGWDVMSVPFWQWDGLDGSAQEQYLRLRLPEGVPRDGSVVVGTAGG